MNKIARWNEDCIASLKWQSYSMIDSMIDYGNIIWQYKSDNIKEMLMLVLLINPASPEFTMESDDYVDEMKKIIIEN